ncbi:MAG: hypothetical protein KDH96_02420 [Candidatus Riesia sp.]|nr:hypothetical protein [Candidatus Riesia sp.]
MIPSNPSDRVEIAQKIDQIVNELQKISDIQSYIKDVKTDLRKEFELTADQIKFLINMRKNRSERNEIEEQTQNLLDDFELLYSTSLSTKSATSVLTVVKD